MKSKDRRYVWALVIAVTLFFPVLIFNQPSAGAPMPLSEVAAVLSASSQDLVTPSTALAGTVLPDIRPRQIVIPSINLNSRVVDVGTTTDGSLGVPENYNEVGWYKYGPIPGEVGSAVFDGHNDDSGLIPGPFKYLHTVKFNDTINVTSADGKTRRFVVTDIQVYPLSKFPGDLVFYDRSGAFIKLITCHGQYIPYEGTYNERLIVTARLVE